METTIFPLSTLPACATGCGHLYDANGACVPPAVTPAAASVYDQCFCSDSRLAPFSTATAGVCDDACVATPADLTSIRNWYTSFCASVDAATTTATATTTTSTGSHGSHGSKSSSGGGNQTWLSTHYQWVIFLVVVVVGIVGIWVGACIWRRHWLRRRDQQYALRKNLANVAGGGGGRMTDASGAALGGGVLQPPAAAPEETGSEKARRDNSRWAVTERT